MELTALSNAAKEQPTVEIRELNDLQLAFIGGGVGEATLG